MCKCASAQGRVGPQGRKQFRMILSRSSPLHLVSRTLFTYPQKRFLDFGPLVWDNKLTINKRITHDKTRNTSRKIRCSGSEVQEPARMHCWDGPTAARAGRSLRRGDGLQHQLARRAKLRHPHTAAAGTDGRGASRVRVKGAVGRGSQEEVQGPGLINRGLRAPSPHTTNAQAHKSYPQVQGTGHKLSTGHRHKPGLKLGPGHRAGGPASAQAIGHKLKDRGAWKKYRESLIVGRGYDPGVSRMLNMECNLVW